MSERVCRIGLMGTATIARKNWQAMRNAPNCTLVAVASRDIERSRRYIAECQSQIPFAEPPRAIGSYAEMLAADDIDAVYIPLPTGVRKQWVIRAAEAGKHVVCEKPCGVDATDVEEILAACNANNVQFMDGVMFMHSARLDRIREVLADGESVGQIKRITSQFSFRAPDDWIQTNIRTSSDLEPAGCLGDLGWYNIRFVLCMMNGQMPERVSGRMLREAGGENSPASVPVELSAEMFFADGVTASFYCSFITNHQQWANISGTKGNLHVRDFVLPNFGAELEFEVSQPFFDINGCDFNMEEHTTRHAVNEFANSEPNAQESLLYRKFGELVLSGTPDPYWGEIALKTQKLVDATLESARKNGDFVEIN